MSARTNASPGSDFFPDWPSPTKTIRRYAFDEETGKIGRQSSVLVDASAHAGIPDGMTMDSEGGIWVCFWGGSSIRHYDETGHLVAEIDVPVANPTSCCFGGSNLTDLFVTTARYGLSPEQISAQPFSGSILRLSAGVVGMRSVPCEIA